ncbi:hypothetical protein EVG20_g3003 [Dentipellis fragilis]|uniref:Uncharacterized protein n=1 Tax=Dentipellis fragilis TaxID=205917 RepID=A0A4Y9Z8T1_9AGAM|nr:hypothetical protein EVG20_g3003 [Dentipellis fragilis]
MEYQLLPDGAAEDIAALAAPDIHFLSHAITLTGVVFSVVVVLVLMTVVALPIWLHVRKQRRQAKLGKASGASSPDSVTLGGQNATPMSDQPASGVGSVGGLVATQYRKLCACRSCRRQRVHSDSPVGRPLSPIMEGEDSTSHISALPTEGGSESQVYASANDQVSGVSQLVPGSEVPMSAQSEDFRVSTSPTYAMVPPPYQEDYNMPAKYLLSIATPSPLPMVDEHNFIQLRVVSPPSPLWDELPTPTTSFDSPQTPFGNDMMFHRLFGFQSSAVALVDPDTSACGDVGVKGGNVWAADADWLYSGCESELGGLAPALGEPLGLGFGDQFGDAAHQKTALGEKGFLSFDDIA